MHYSRSIEFRGDAGKAFDLAAAALAGVGFRIDARTDSSLEATGPGMTSSRQSPLVGASRVRFTRSAGELAADAELGGARRIGRFATLFPLRLCLFLCVVLTAVFWAVFGRPEVGYLVAGVTGLNAALWLVLGPVIGRSVRRRTERGIDALLDSMAAVGGR